MDYKGVECPVCKNIFTENDDIVVCPECGAPHHRACWFSVNHCAFEEKHAEGFVFEAPRKQEENASLFGNAFGPRVGESVTDEDCSEIPEKMEQQTQGDFEPVIQTPILGGMGKLGIDFGSDPTIAGIPIAEATAFVGADSFSSGLLFKMALTDRFKSIRINFFAFLFPYLWFFYRKMYKLGAVVMALMLLSTAVFTNSNTIKYQQKLLNLYMQAAGGQITLEDYNAQLLKIQEEGTGNSYAYELAPQIINLVIRIFFALMANKFYLEHMKKQVFKIREECSSMDEYMAALVRRGGKSVGAAVLSAIAFAVLNTGLMAALYAVLI